MHVRLFGRKPWALLDMAAGINRHGDTWQFTEFKDHDLKHAGIDCDAVLFMGWVPEAEAFGAYYRLNVPVFYITDGYARRRRYDLRGPDNYSKDAHFGVSKNLPGGYGDFNYSTHPPDRWQKLGYSTVTRQRLGTDCLIGFQETPDIFNQTRGAFFKEVLDFITPIDGLYVRMRLHPRFDERVDITKTILYGFQGRVTRAMDEPLHKDLDGAYCLITYDSNIAVEAALLGYPIVEYGRSMAHPIAMQWDEFKRHHGCVKVLTEKRYREWCHWLAYQQWTRAEMAHGKAWEYIKQYLL